MCRCEYDVCIYVDQLRETFCVKCFINEELHKRIHAKDLFINIVTFDELKEYDDSREMREFVDYYADYGRIYSIQDLLAKECENHDNEWINSIYTYMSDGELLEQLDTNWCSKDLRATEFYLCPKCKFNLRKVAYYMTNGDIANIVQDWPNISVPDNFIHEPAK